MVMSSVAPSSVITSNDVLVAVSECVSLRFVLENMSAVVEMAPLVSTASGVLSCWCDVERCRT